MNSTGVGKVVDHCGHPANDGVTFAQQLNSESIQSAVMMAGRRTHPQIKELTRVMMHPMRLQIPCLQESKPQKQMHQPRSRVCLTNLLSNITALLVSSSHNRATRIRSCLVALWHSLLARNCGHNAPVPVLQEMLTDEVTGQRQTRCSPCLQCANGARPECCCLAPNEGTRRQPWKPPAPRLASSPPESTAQRVWRFPVARLLTAVS